MQFAVFRWFARNAGICFPGARFAPRRFLTRWGLTVQQAELETYEAAQVALTLQEPSHGHLQILVSERSSVFGQNDAV